MLKPLAHRAARAAGHDLVRRAYYSPIPWDTPPEAWNRIDPLHGITFDLDAQLAWLERVAGEVDMPQLPSSRMFGPVDGELLYGAIRHEQPERVVELGSGTTSTIIDLALGRAHEVFDPIPNTRTNLPVRRLSATDVPIEVFTSLAANDILFVDTTHTVKTGGDVNRIFLEILPQLAPGVIVHVHDIFLPYEYPREWHERGLHWAEQYLLQAFLVGNDEWEILCGACAVARAHPDRVRRAIPRFEPETVIPGSFWLRRR